MKIFLRLIRLTLAAAAGVAVLGASSTAALAHHGDRVMSFHVDHTDICVAAVTDGMFTRVATHPPELSRVDVAGTLEVARPEGCVPVHPATAYAEFTAFGEVSGEYVEVDHEIVPGYVHSSIPYEFSLDATVAAPLIDFIELHVCVQRSDTGETTCGFTGVYVP